LIADATEILTAKGIKVPPVTDLPPDGFAADDRVIVIPAVWQALVGALPGGTPRRETVIPPFPVVQWRHGSEGSVNHSMATPDGQIDAAVDGGFFEWPSETASVGAVFVTEPDDYWLTITSTLSLASSTSMCTLFSAMPTSGRASTCLSPPRTAYAGRTSTIRSGEPHPSRR